MEEKYDLKWLTIGIVIALLNPIFSGIILGVTYLSEEHLRKEGRLVLGFALVWAVVVNVLKRSSYL